MEHSFWVTHTLHYMRRRAGASRIWGDPQLILTYWKRIQNGTACISRRELFEPFIMQIMSVLTLVSNSDYFYSDKDASVLLSGRRLSELVRKLSLISGHRCDPLVSLPSTPSCRRLLRAAMRTSTAANITLWWRSLRQPRTTKLSMARSSLRQSGHRWLIQASKR